MKYTFSDVDFGSTGGGFYIIAGIANNRPFVADNDGLEAYTNRYIDIDTDAETLDEFIEEEINDVDFWEALIKYLYDTMGDEYGTIIKHLSGD